jgi:hypothetical protein
MPENNKETKPQVSYDKLEQKIRVSLSSADAYTKHNQKLNSALTITTIVSSALTAFLTGLTAAQGPVVIQGVLDWQGACSLGAILSVITTISSGVSQQMNISKRLIEGSQCAGRLRALELIASTKAREASEITIEYAEILRTYSEVTK